MKRVNSIVLECPHCKDLNRSRVDTLSCIRGSSNIIRTRICLKCNKKYFTSERVIGGYEAQRDSLRKSFNTLEANLKVLRNKVIKLNG